jgi:endonuclease G, mitochondrial
MANSNKALQNVLLEKNIVIDQDYSDRKGYNENFLKTKIPLPQLTAEQKKLAVKVKGESTVLKYCHFSIVMNKIRKLPFFAAVNIDGVSYNKIRTKIPPRGKIGSDKWYIDPRIDDSLQVHADFYKGNDFDLGHLIRREYALYGKDLDEAIKGNNDTFHLTNATPQHKKFNQGALIWKGLEDYAIKKCRENFLKISVFDGPVFGNNDITFKGVKIPNQFWKIITMIKPDGKLSSTGYLVSQESLVHDMKLEAFTYGRFQTFQVPISKIEELTGYKFNLSKYDPLNEKGFKLESISMHVQQLIDKKEKIVF